MPDLMNTKTNEDILQLAKEEWLNVLAGLWLAYDKPLDLERLTLYQEMLSDIPLGLLERAIKRTIRKHKYNSVPTVRDVWDAVRAELGNPPDIFQAIRNWEERLWSGVSYRFGAVAVETDAVHASA